MKVSELNFLDVCYGNGWHRGNFGEAHTSGNWKIFSLVGENELVVYVQITAKIKRKIELGSGNDSCIKADHLYFRHFIEFLKQK